MGDAPPGEPSAQQLRIRLEHGEATPDQALQRCAAAALDAPTRAARLDACRLLGDLAGRALGAGWDVAERAAFALLEAGRVADTAAALTEIRATAGKGGALAVLDHELEPEVQVAARSDADSTPPAERVHAAARRSCAVGCAVAS